MLEFNQSFETKFNGQLYFHLQVTTDSTCVDADKEIIDENETKIPDDAVKNTTVVKKVKRKVGLREFNREEIAIINRRNIELIQSLKTLDSAFSMGESGQYI